MGVSLKDLPGGQWLLAEGREKGLEEGREKGLEEGIEEGRRAMARLVRGQAATRFGADPRLDAILDLDIERLGVVGVLIFAPDVTIGDVLGAAQPQG